MPSGSLIANIGPDQNMTQGEDRPIRHRVTDENGDPVLSFSGWTFAWYLLYKLNGELSGENLIFVKTTAGGDITPSAPNVTITIEPEDTEDLKAGTYFYEFWRTDSGNKVRLARGTVSIID